MTTPDEVWLPDQLSHTAATRPLCDYVQIIAMCGGCKNHGITIHLVLYLSLGNLERNFISLRSLLHTVESFRNSPRVQRVNVAIYTGIVLFILLIIIAR